MKAAILGYSGAGKSTLAGKLGHFYDCPVLHLDWINFLPGWKERDREEAKEMVERFLDENRDKGWIIDGNYSKLHQERRLKEADLIILMNFPRRICLYQAFRRFFEYKGKTRESMAEGCHEKIDFAFIKWILFDGRKKGIRNHYREIEKVYGEKVLVIKNHRQLKTSIIQLAERSKKRSWR